MSLEDASLTRTIMRDIGKHQVDVSKLMVNVSHGVVYLRGEVKAIRGFENVNLKDEMHLIAKVLRQRSGVRDVVTDVQLSGWSNLSKSSDSNRAFR